MVHICYLTSPVLIGINFLLVFRVIQVVHIDIRLDMQYTSAVEVSVLRSVMERDLNS